MLWSAKKLQLKKLSVDGRLYKVRVLQRTHQPPQAPRLLIVAYQPNEAARHILRVCLQTIQRYTPEPHEVWVLDNNSPPAYAKWLLQWPGINLGLNRTEPLPPGKRGWLASLRGQTRQSNSGSYANAVGLELAIRLLNPRSHYVMSLHMDTMPCREGWLSFLQAKIKDNIGAAGVRMDRTRTPEGVLHVLGYMVDFQLFRRLKLDFFPQLPQYDVGDRVTTELRQAGYEVFACPNSLWQPELVETIPPHSPWRTFPIDRAFDDRGEVIFLHLGRGVNQALNRHKGQVTPEQWIEFAETYLL